MVTSALSSSVIFTVAATGVPIEILASPDVIASRVVVTVSVASKILLFITERSINALNEPAGIVTDSVNVT